VRENETVHAHHHGHGEFLGDPERLDVQVKRLLAGLGVELDPAGVALRHRVAVIVPDVDRGADGAVGDGHHDRQAEAGGVVDGLRHVQQALAGGGGVGPRPGRRRADRHRHRGEFGLDIDELATSQVAPLHRHAERLDDVGLRGDRVGADHFRAAQRQGLGDRP